MTEAVGLAVSMLLPGKMMVIFIVPFPRRRAGGGVG
jgi:hypothetical protein